MFDISCVICSLRLERRSYKDLSGLLHCIVIVFVYVKCKVMQNMIT